MLEMVILQTSPFWVSLIGIWLNNEKVMRIEYIGMVVCFAAVLSITFYKQEDIEVSASSYDDSTRLLGMGLAFLLSWVYSFTCCFNRRLKNVHFAIVLFYHSIFGFLISGVIIIFKALITGDAILIFNFTGTQYLFILCGCAFDWLSLSLQTRAF